MYYLAAISAQNIYNFDLSSFLGKEEGRNFSSLVLQRNMTHLSRKGNPQSCADSTLWPSHCASRVVHPGDDTGAAIMVESSI